DDLSKAGIPSSTISKIRSKVTVSTEKVSTKSEKSTAKDTKTPSTSAKDSKSSTIDNKTTTDTKPAAVDLNKATSAQLQELPGIGEASATKIIKNRPYKSVDDLAKAGISTSTIAKIRKSVTVGGETIATTTKGTTSSKTAMPKVDAGLINLNTATEQQI